MLFCFYSPSSLKLKYKQMQSEQLVQKISKLLSLQTDLELAWIYGSYASGRQTDQSDIDIAVAGNTPLTTERRLELSEQLTQVTHKEIDLVDLQAAHGIIFSQVLTLGKLVVNKNSPLYAQLIKRMWFDRADFWPQRSQLFSNLRKRAFES